MRHAKNVKVPSEVWMEVADPGAEQVVAQSAVLLRRVDAATEHLSMLSIDSRFTSSRRGDTMHIPIDPAASAPIYEQIREGISAGILAGDLVAGEALPSIRALARDLRVSVITTTRAYNELVADGLVDAVRGKGVFVRAQDPHRLRDRAFVQIDEAFDAAVRAARDTGIEDRELTNRLAQRLEGGR